MIIKSWLKNKKSVASTPMDNSTTKLNIACGHLGAIIFSDRVLHLAFWYWSLELNIHLVCKKVLPEGFLQLWSDIFMAVIVGVGVSVGIFIAKFDKNYEGNYLILEDIFNINIHS